MTRDISQRQPWPANPFSEGFLAIGCRMVSTDHFRQAIRSRFELASAQGRQDLTIECGELYWSVSKLPVFDPWMIFCCNAMRAEMAVTDRLIFDDSKASLLTIHYALPRHQRSPPKSNYALFGSNSMHGCAERSERQSRVEAAPTTSLSSLLFQNGLPDLPVVLVEPHRNHGGIWRIKFSYDADQPLSMSAEQASLLATDLHQMGEDELADEIDDAVRSATRYSSM